MLDINLPADELPLGVVVVDHGSRREESNVLLADVVALFRQVTRATIVELAHMELAEPSITTAFDRCVQQGAKTVVVFPYFLFPGRHWDQDIPRLAAEAATRHSKVQHLVTAPLGVHALLAEVMAERIRHCLDHARNASDACELCAGTDHCQLHSQL